LRAISAKVSPKGTGLSEGKKRFCLAFAFLEVDFSAFEQFTSLGEGFGLLLVATGIVITYYRGKRKH
jgi:hypothetical protein